MSNKFDGVTTDEDTKILLSEVTNFGDYKVKYERWIWDGISAESLIFFNDDIAGTTEDKLKNQILGSPIAEADTQITIQRKEPYTFFNFNFHHS